MELTQEYLKSILSYDPDTGVFIRLVSFGYRAKAGDIAGSPDKNGYLRICISGKSYKAHRLAWLYMTGEWPKDQIDHIDMEQSNNRFSNLREANYSQNQSNRPVRKNSKSGYKGVYFLKNKKDRPWMAQIKVMGKDIYLGMFKTKEMAYSAYCKAAEKYQGDFARY